VPQMNKKEEIGCFLYHHIVLGEMSHSFHHISRSRDEGGLKIHRGDQWIGKHERVSVKLRITNFWGRDRKSYVTVR